MHLPRLFRTSGFRLTLFYAGLCCTSFVALFAILYWSSSALMSHQVDEALLGEIAELKAAGAGSGPDRSAAVITEFAARSPDFLYLLQSPAGIKLAGNFPATVAPIVGARKLPRSDMAPEDAILGRGERLTDGSYLFVGRDTQDVVELEKLIRESFEWGLAITIVVALGGGAFASHRVLKRVETMSIASRDIMAGDLNRRLVVRGTDDEFDHLAVSLNNMLDRVQALMEGLRQVSSDIAHELRTPLTRLRQRAELAARGPNDAEALRGALNRALADIDSVLETFAAVLRIAQVEATSGRRRFAAVDLTEILKTIVEIYLPMAEEKQQSLEEGICARLVAEGDRELLMRLFANLLENAIRHSPAKAHIAVRTSAASESIDVVIADDGEGIPEAMRSRVFGRFFRMETSRTTPGNGLGLSLAAAIATLHQTEIELTDNRPGLKARIRLRKAMPGQAITEM